MVTMVGEQINRFQSLAARNGWLWMGKWMVTMVTMIRSWPLDLNDFNPRCDDADVTETSDPLGGFRIMSYTCGTGYPRSRRPGSRAASSTTIRPFRGRTLNESNFDRSIRIVYA